MAGRCDKIVSRISSVCWLIVNSIKAVSPCNSPMLANRYRSPNAQCGYFAFRVARTMEGMAGKW